MYKMLTIKWMKLLVHILYEEIQKQIADNRWTIPTRIDSIWYLFSASTIGVSLSHRQARDNAIRANSLGTWFFSKEYLCGHYGTSFINYPAQNRGERGWLPTCGEGFQRETFCHLIWRVHHNFSDDGHSECTILLLCPSKNFRQGN